MVPFGCELSFSLSKKEYETIDVWKSDFERTYLLAYRILWDLKRWIGIEVTECWVRKLLD
jgi:hypothetical protein